MKQVTIKLSVQLVAQIPANVDHKVIIHEGRVYADLGDMSALIGVSDDDGEATTTTKKTAPAEKKAAPAKKAAAVEEETADETEKTPPAKRKPAAKAETKKEEPVGEDEFEERIIEILGDLDQAEINDKKAVDLIAALSDESDEKAIRKIIKDFQEDPAADMAEVAAELLIAVTGAEPEPEKEEKKPASRKKPAAKEEKAAPAKKVKKEEPKTDEPEDVEIDELEEGDVVGVWFDSMEEWYMGVVLKVTKKGTVVKYDDDQEELVLDPAEHTQIVRYPEEA